ncbi:hypothetical protein [Nocardia beijingensis]
MRCSAAAATSTQRTTKTAMRDRLDAAILHFIRYLITRLSIHIG